MPAIVVLDGHTLNPGDNPWDALAQLGALSVYERTPPELVVARAADADIVLTNKVVLDRGVIDALPRLRFITVTATGYNVVDMAAARARGVVVSNVPEYGTESVAQHVFALLLALTQQVCAHDAAVKRGEWTRAPDFCFWLESPVELHGLTMGLVGFGRIGRRVGELAHGFGMRVLASSRSRAPAAMYDDFAWADIDEVFERADVVSLHVPLDERTHQLVDARRLARMRASAFLINTARGGLLDEHAVAEALRAGRLAAAAVDVASVEPIRADNPLLHAPRCLITPHLAWASLAARRRLMAATVANVRAFLGGHPINVVA